MIYILEDDESIRNFVVYALNNSGFEARGFGTPGVFWESLKKETPQLLLLDIMLPEEDGIEILKRLRKREVTKRLPIIMLTAKGSEYDKIIGLDSGADDYMTKPFSIMELISRVKALLRRTSEQKEAEEYSVGGLYVNPAKHIVKANGENITLTLKEFELLALLIANRGIVFNRDQIFNKIWGYDFDGENRTVDVHVRTLRAKLGECGQLIETVRGIGYKIGGNENDKADL
ncbi:MAG TPA: response regulator transcription factor [Clostridiales bacterium]|nr:response regulator transcription factor [Clostridiales bacterium]